MGNEKLAEQAVREILLKQIPKRDRLKGSLKRPTKEELNKKFRLVKR